MVLQLNLQSEGDRYTEHYGSNIAQMPLLLDSGRVPLSTAGIMKRRLEVRSPEFGNGSEESKTVRKAWWTNNCDSGDGPLYHPNGKIKVVTDASFLRGLKPETILVDYAVLLADSDEEARIKYNQIDAPEFTREQIQKDRFGTIWLALARWDKSLLDNYMSEFVANFKEIYGLSLTKKEIMDYYKNDIMSVNLRIAPEPVCGRLWRVGKSNLFSDIDGGSYLDLNTRCLIGIVSDAQSPVVSVQERMPLVSLDNIVRPSFEEVMIVIRNIVSNYDPKTPLSEEHFRSAIENLYK